MIMNDKGLSFTELTSKEKHRIIFNIFHDGTTLLKMLCMPTEIELQNGANECKAIFEAAQNEPTPGFENGYEVPILQDVYGMTALDYALGFTYHLKNLKGNFKELESDYSEEISQNRQSQMAEIIFEGIKDYRFNSVGPALVPAIIEALKQGNYSVANFLDGRQQYGSFITNNSMPPIKPDYLYELDSIGEYGAMEVSSFEYEESLKEKMFETDGL